MLALCHAEGCLTRATAWPSTPASKRCWQRSPSWPGRARSRPRSTLRRPHFRAPAGADRGGFHTIDEPTAAAMRTYPELIRGPCALDNEPHAGATGLDRQGRGRGTLLRSVSQGLGVARSRGRHAACATARGRVVSRPGRVGVRTVPVTNSREEVVGEARARPVRRRLGGAAIEAVVLCPVVPSATPSARSQRSTLKRSLLKNFSSHTCGLLLSSRAREVSRG